MEGGTPSAGRDATYHQQARGSQHNVEADRSQRHERRATIPEVTGHNHFHQASRAKGEAAMDEASRTIHSQRFQEHDPSTLQAKNTSSRHFQGSSTNKKGRTHPTRKTKEEPRQQPMDKQNKSTQRRRNPLNDPHPLGFRNIELHTHKGQATLIEATRTIHTHSASGT